MDGVTAEKPLHNSLSHVTSETCMGPGKLPPTIYLFQFVPLVLSYWSGRLNTCSLTLSAVAPPDSAESKKVSVRGPTQAQWAYRELQTSIMSLPTTPLTTQVRQHCWLVLHPIPIAA